MKIFCQNEQVGTEVELVGNAQNTKPWLRGCFQHAIIMRIWAVLCFKFRYFQYAIIWRFDVINFAASTASGVDSFFGINNESKKMDTDADTVTEVFC